MAETQVRYGECYAVGNDLKQAQGRSFREALYSLALTPGWNPNNETLPGRWKTKALSLECITTGTKIVALAVDAKGEAGGKPAFQVWTELWGFEYEDALRFWDELTPVPTIPDSMRMVETYAGYDGESTLLWNLYEEGLKGRQLTLGEMARNAASDRPGESYEELLEAFAECEGDPSALVPVWVNDETGLFMYWDSGPQARRMPWQQGEEGARYYREQEASLPPRAFQRFHYNYWVGAESSFVPIESFDACYDPSVPPLIPGERTPIVLAVDAATSGDCFAIAAVARNPNDHDHVDVRAYKVWKPEEDGGRIDYAKPEAWLRMICGLKTADGRKAYNVVEIAYDPYQLESMMQGFKRDRVANVQPFPQGQDRLRADRGLYDKIMNLGLHHRENPAAPFELREHIQNANAKLQKDQDSTMRIVKKAGGRKIDLAVATSMATARCLYLRLPRTTYETAA